MVVISLPSDFVLGESSTWLASVFHYSFYLIPIFFFINRSCLGFFSTREFDRVWKIGFDEGGVEDWTDF